VSSVSVYIVERSTAVTAPLLDFMTPNELLINNLKAIS
jgi:hypothetical protein